MIKRMVCLFGIAILTMAISCKQKDDEIVGTAVNPHHVPMNGMHRIPIQRKRTPPADGKYPRMAFPQTEHDFGNINQGDIVSYYFEFKNNGEADLVISNAVGSCGCTVPEVPKEAINPGASARIKVTFNSAGKTGIQHKTVTLTTNTEAGEEILKIKASINPVSGANMQPVATPNK